MARPRSYDPTIFPRASSTTYSGQDPNPFSRPASALRRIGTWGLIPILGGVVLQLLVLTLLAFLWAQQNRDHGTGDNKNPGVIETVWRAIAINNYMTMVVTISSAVIRFLVGPQLVVCTALSAGLLLETTSTRFEDAPKLSILRAYNDGPYDIVEIALMRFWTLRRRPRHFRLTFQEALVTLLFVLSIAIQFSSTLLVSDLDETVIQSDSYSQRMPVVDLTGNFITPSGLYMWTKSPGVWSTSAEARDGNSSVALELTDTGTITRAYLPFEAQDRLRLRSYKGRALTQEARTVCVPADLENIRLGLYGGTDQIKLVATVSASMFPFHRAGIQVYNRPNKTNSRPVTVDSSPEMTGIPFECPFYGVMDGGGPGARGDSLVLAICSIGDMGFQRFVLINVSGEFNDWYGKVGVPGPLRRVTGTRASENSWANYDAVDVPEKARNTMRLQASLCGSRHQHAIQDISASIQTEPKEYPFKWDNDTQQWNTDAILNLLGVIDGGSTPESRGNLRLESSTPIPPVPLSKDLEKKSEYLRFGYGPTVEAMTYSFDRGISPSNSDLFSIVSGIEPSDRPYNLSLIFCTRCNEFSRNDTVHPSHVILMQAALNATNNPAAALDGLWASWTSALYMSVVGQLDGAGPDNSTMVWAITVRAPRRWRGFIAMVGLLSGHIVIMFLITGLFMLKTSYSFRAASWQAIAQVAVGEDVKGTLEDVTLLSDDEVAELIKARGLERVCLSTQVDGSSGGKNVALRRKGASSQMASDSIEPGDSHRLVPSGAWTAM